MTDNTTDNTPAELSAGDVAPTKKRKKSPRTYGELKPGDTFTVHGMTCDVIQLDHIEHPSRPRVAITYRDSDTGRYFDRVYAAELPVG